MMGAYSQPGCSQYILIEGMAVSSTLSGYIQDPALDEIGLHNHHRFDNVWNRT
jgi:hypothetical protein